MLGADHVFGAETRETSWLLDRRLVQDGSFEIEIGAWSRPTTLVDLEWHGAARLPVVGDLVPLSRGAACNVLLHDDTSLMFGPGECPVTDGSFDTGVGPVSSVEIDLGATTTVSSVSVNLPAQPHKRGSENRPESLFVVTMADCVNVDSMTLGTEPIVETTPVDVRCVRVEREPPFGGVFDDLFEVAVW